MKIFHFFSPPAESGSEVSFDIQWFQPPPDRSCEDQTVIIPIKFSITTEPTND
jgi:hypothetical protein